MNYSHILNELRAEADIEVKIGFLNVQTEKLHFDAEQVSHYNIKHFDDMKEANQYDVVIVSSDMYLNNSAAMKLAVKNGLILIVMFCCRSERGEPHGRSPLPDRFGGSRTHSVPRAR